MPSFLYEVFINNIKKNKNKKIIHSLTESLSGKECLNKIEKINKYLILNKIKTIGLNSTNSIEWILWYISAKKHCKKIFIFNQNTPEIKIKNIAKKYFIDLIVKNNKKIIFPNSEKKKREKIYIDILYTSGTSNEPKGALISEKAYLHVAKFLIKKFKHTNKDLELLSMPFSHSFGLTRLRCNIIAGSSILVTNGLNDFPSIYNFSKTRKITGLSLVPSGVELIKYMLKNNTINFIENLNYFEIGSSLLNDDSRIWLKKNFNKTLIYHHYGMTEASRSFMIGRGYLDNIKQTNNFIGSPIKDCKAKLNKINKNNIGELLIKGKNLFDGYINDEDNKNRFIDGWYKTGDLCKKQGRKFKIIGRVDNQINIGGNKVHAEIIEEKLEKLPNILRSLCFSTKNVFYGNSISLIIEKKKKSSTNTIRKNILKNFEKEPSFLIPKKILFKKIKLTNNGKKIRKFQEI